MEAATPLRKPTVRTTGDRVAVDGLLLDDETTVRLVREREQAGGGTVELIEDAVEIGARVLDREHAAANTDFVKTEFEKVSADVQRSFSEEARAAAEALQAHLEEVFGPENGHLAKALERLFSDGSSSAVQNRVREVVAEVMNRSREDLLKQFSAADGHNPLADFKAGTVDALNRASEAQNAHMRAMLERMAGLERELQRLRDERDKQLELAEAEEAGTRKGRSFEQAVHDALDRIALAQGDVCEAVGDARGATGKKGDVIVDIDAASGPPRGRVVFEAKDERLSGPAALRELDEARANRDADFAVLVVPSEGEVPARMLSLREYNGDKMIVAYEPEDGSTLCLQVAYSLARARVVMAGGGGGAIDGAALGEAAERAIAAVNDLRKVKSQLTGATTSITNARTLLEAIEGAVRAQLDHIGELLAAGRSND
jgi:hypothetical protein